MSDVVVSHTGQDNSAAIAIAEQLKKRGIDVWLDLRVLQRGSLRPDDIERQAREHRIMIVVLSKATAGALDAKKNVWRILLDGAAGAPHHLDFGSREPWIRRLSLIPVQIEACDVPFELANYTTYKLFDVESGQPLNHAGLSREIERIARNIRRILSKKYIFISYRRSDSAIASSEIFDVLSQHIGAEYLFRDVNSIGPGEDFAAKLEDTLAVSEVFVPLVGESWMSSFVERRHKCEGEIDYVMKEVETAAERNMRTLPVLIDGARMPNVLPNDWPLSFVAAKNAITYVTGSRSLEIAAFVGGS